MSLSFRSLPSLLLPVLLGVGSVAVAGPRQDSNASATPPAATQGQAHKRQRGERPAPPRHDRHEDALSDSVRRIERSTRGQVLSAERVPYEGRDLNRIKVVDDRGRVRVYMDDPARSDSGRSEDDEQRRTRAPTRGDDD
jgi:hypothetical protein